MTDPNFGNYDGQWSDPIASGSAAYPATELLSIEKSSRHSSLIDQAYDEYCQLIENGESVDPDEFCARFPWIRKSLAKLIQAHQFLNEHASVFPEPPADDWPAVGEVFLGFRLVEELGKGAFARVFRALDLARGGKVVAVKVSYCGGSEARILGPLEHENIIPVDSAPRDEKTGLTAVCMPYRGRATLCQLLDRIYCGREQPQHARVILEAARDPDQEIDTKRDVLWEKGTLNDGIYHIGLRLAEALAFIHKHGICHRDLKPSNVLLAPSGDPMLLDFNLSTNPEDPIGQIGGTLTYMSPEQLRAMNWNKDEEPDQVPLLDWRTDIFSFGVILFELFTGKHPFGDISLKLPIRQLRDELLHRQENRQNRVPLQLLNPNVPAHIAALVEQCLAQDPKDRPQDANILAAAFRKELARLIPKPRWKRLFAAAALMLLSTTITIAAAFTGAFNQQDVAPVMDVNAWLARGYKAFDEAQRTPNGAKRTELFEEAYKSFEKVAVLAPNNEGWPKALLGYYEQVRAVKDPSLIEFYYEKAIKLGFATVEVRNNLGWIYCRRERPTEAIEQFDIAIQQSDEFSIAYFNRSLAYFNLGSLTRNQSGANVLPKEHVEKANEYFELARLDLERAIALGLKNGKVYRRLATVHLMLAETDPTHNKAVVENLRLAVLAGERADEIWNNEVFERLRQCSIKACATIPVLAQPSPINVDWTTVTALLYRANTEAHLEFAELANLRSGPSEPFEAFVDPVRPLFHVQLQR